MDSTINLVKRHFSMLFIEKWTFILLILWFSYALGLPHLTPLSTVYLILYFALLPTFGDLKTNVVLLPLKKSQFVVSRYIFNFVISIVIITFTAIALNISYGLETEAGKFALLVNIIISLGVLVIFMPLSFKIKTVSTLTAIVVGPTVFFITLLGFKIDDIKNGFDSVPFNINTLTILLVFVGFSILYFLSMRLSIKLFEKRELDL
ncbi:MAG: ABC-2 transporter permease [Sarcina sp.]